LSGSSLGKIFGKISSFKMNWVLENLIQGTSGGLEDMLLEFQTQVNYANFYGNQRTIQDLGG
jgi:hypothetical protein